jgi:hypothetical protein
MIFLICLSTFIISGDVFFCFYMGGFTLRIYQFLLIPVSLKALLELLRNAAWPLGFGNLLIWTFFIILFVPNTNLLNRNVYYAAWLVSSVLIVLGITAVVDSPEKLNTVVRWYTYSFAFSAIFGLVQFFLPLVGGPGLLVVEWWIPDKLARINGFTYEPSYFATYMISGWVMTDYLRYKKYKLRGLSLTFWLITAAMLLSSSRAGWITMAGWLAVRGFWNWRAKTFPWRPVLLVGAAALAVLLFMTVGLGLGVEDYEVVTSGLGIIDETGSFSAEGRWDKTIETLNVWVAHPIIGVSLGGVASEIARQDGYGVSDNDDVKSTQGLCTTAEVLAASGTFGFIFYVLYMITLCRGMLRLRTDNPIGAALGWSFICLLFILQLDQNILRGYVWLHIGILSAAYRVLSAPDLVASRQTSPALSPSAAVS